jgi:5-methylcytosine-specific restriction endonuclease McrA
MKRFERSHLSSPGLLSLAATHLAQDRNTTADLLADMAEIEKRRLYAPAGYDSMYMFCVHAWGISEDVACNRIRAARAARRYPVIFEAVAEGRLHLSAVVLLAPHLKREPNREIAAGLIAAASHKSKADLELMLAERYPKPDVPTVLRPIAVQAAAPEVTMELAPSKIPPAALPASALPPSGSAGDPVISSVPGRIDPSDPAVPAQAMVPLQVHPKLAPLSPGRFALQVTIDHETHDALRQAQALLGHSVPSGDLATVLKRAVQAYVQLLEKQKFAKTDRPRPQRKAPKGRHIPAAVRRAVRERDGGQCTFVSEQGKRCESRFRLEFDHVEAFARGGQSTIGGLRLRCRAHNHYGAECEFGAGFMESKLQQARERTERRHAEVGANGPG